MQRRGIVLLVAAAGLAAVAVGSADEDSKPAAVRFTEHMHGHLEHVNAIKTAVIAGELESARSPAAWLSEHDEPPGAPDSWSPYLWEMRQYAATAAAARDLQTVAVAVSEIARTCGECHRANRVDIAFDIAPRPPGEPQDVRTQMQRHLWAADRMWEGLLGPSDAAWSAGTKILAEVKLSSAQLDEDPGRAARVEELVQEIRALGQEGARTPAGPARSLLYGKFLSTCASCHGLTGGGPAAARSRVTGPADRTSQAPGRRQ